MNFHQHALILDIVERLQQHGSKVGKTHVHKALFLVQVAEYATHSPKEPFKFVLYRHGPYSFPLDDAIEEMFIYDALQGSPLNTTGTALVPGSNAAFLHKVVLLQPHEENANERICELIGSSDVRTLEKWATIAWIRRVEGLLDSVEIAERLNVLKPHISVEEAMEADEHTVAPLLEDRQEFSISPPSSLQLQHSR